MTGAVARQSKESNLAVERRYQIKFIVGGLAILAAFAFLLINSLDGLTMYTLTVAELHAKIPNVYNANVRVSGLVLPGSVRYDAQNMRLDLIIADDVQQSSQTLPVVYYGPKPGGLREEGQAIIEGQLHNDGIFYAHQRDDALKSKCASKYEQAP